MATKQDETRTIVICDHLIKTYNITDLTSIRVRCLRSNKNVGLCGVPDGQLEEETGVNCCSVAFHNSAKELIETGVAQSNRFQVFPGEDKTTVVIQNELQQFIRTTSGRVISSIKEVK